MRIKLEGDDREFEFVKRLTFDEGELVEGILGRDISGLAWAKLGSVLRQRILVFCSIRRQVPTFAWADLRDVPMDGVDAVLDESEQAAVDAVLKAADEPEVPTAAGVEAGPKPRKRAPARRSPRSA